MQMLTKILIHLASDASVFTNALAVAMAVGPNQSANIFVAGIDFLDSLNEDAVALNDPQLTTLVEAVRALPEWAPGLPEDGS